MLTCVERTSLFRLGICMEEKMVCNTDAWPMVYCNRLGHEQQSLYNTLTHTQTLYLFYSLRTQSHTLYLSLYARFFTSHTQTHFIS